MCLLGELLELRKQKAIRDLKEGMLVDLEHDLIVILLLTVTLIRKYIESLTQYRVV